MTGRSRNGNSGIGSPVTSNPNEVEEVRPFASLASRTTSYVPGAKYECDALLSADQEVSQVPSPSQSHLTSIEAEEVSASLVEEASNENNTPVSAVEGSTLNDATGGVFTRMSIDSVCH